MLFMEKKAWVVRALRLRNGEDEKSSITGILRWVIGTVAVVAVVSGMVYYFYNTYHQSTSTVSNINYGIASANYTIPGGGSVSGNGNITLPSMP
ncbi:hypothetical protein FY534_07605 [Alicyclobacillus sp. TC]|uniref:Uncharacterized protein n=1 Tax=Alicyclobacillus tolerans TaxID=90970 RepID=A0ABT9LZA1_9BACL|nr:MULTISPECIES: hypothetical protein [Alicyclobacillus]MDP9729575.1 hypothetical protein [Alicyclobacillus tengchongensis]QRF23550.1 hypothetical protein FY534_07605 [Alicyclobacillus sp. TC]